MENRFKNQAMMIFITKHNLNYNLLNQITLLQKWIILVLLRSLRAGSQILAG
jgi:hypothetical protein